MIHGRKLIGLFASVLGMGIIRPLSAAIATPRATEGPFYPLDNAFLSDTDNDLVIVDEAVTSAGGQILHLTGTVRDNNGTALPNAQVEIWQCDVNGRYIHSDDRSMTRVRDPYFQGYGTTRTDAQGQYSFRTIKPVPYPGRTPHIHFKIHDPRNGAVLTTQMYVANEAQNKRDWLYNRMSTEEKQIVTVDLQNRANQTLAGEFDITS